MPSSKSTSLKPDIMVLNASENPLQWFYAMTKDQDEEWNKFSLQELELVLKDNLSLAVRRGFILPIYCVLISNNGGIVAVHFKVSKEGKHVVETVAEYASKDLFYPLHLFFSDSSGKAFGTTINDPRESNLKGHA